MPTGREDCGRENCQILNPLRPELWCRACLIEHVVQLRRKLATSPYNLGVLFPQQPSAYDY